MTLRPSSRSASRIAGALLAAALALVLAPGPLRAADAEPAAPVAPAPEPPPIPAGEIAGRADALTAMLRERQAEAATEAAVKAIEDKLPERAKSLASERAELAGRLDSELSVGDLEALRSRWRATADEISAEEQRLADRVARLDQRLDELTQTREVWLRTQESARESGAPAAILGQVESTLGEIASLRNAFEKRRNELLTLQSRVAEQRRLVAQAVAEIEAARSRVLATLFVPDQSPLWRARPATELPPGAPAPVGWATSMLGPSRDYVLANPVRFGAHALLFVVLVILARRARAALDRRLAEAAGTGDLEGRIATRRAFERPLAVALVLALLATPWIHPQAPREILALGSIVLLAPALVVVLYALLPGALRPMLYALACFFLADRVRDAIDGLPFLGRLVFLGERALALLFLVWLRSSARLQHLPAALLRSGWLRALSLWLQASMLGLLVSILAGVFGYGRLSLLVGEAVLAASYLAVLLYAGARLLGGLSGVLLRSRLLQRSRMVARNTELFVQGARRAIRGLAALGWILALLSLLALRDPFFRGVGSMLSASFGYGSFSLSLGGLLAFAVTLVASWGLARLLHFTLTEEVYPRVSLPRGVPFAIATITRYVIVVLGFLLAVAMLGFDLDRLTLLASAVAVGVGFGLQTIVNNFVSGLILLFERPIQVGDRVQIADLYGDVVNIGIRASTVRTFDGADVIVPNSVFIVEQLTNWTFSDKMRRIILPVGVAYGTDPERVLAVMREVAVNHPKVLAQPPPAFLFRGFGDSSLDFEMRVFIDDYDRLLGITSELAIGVNNALRGAGIEIPFPQRDLHLRSVDAKAATALEGRQAPPQGGGEPSSS